MSIRLRHVAWIALAAAALPAPAAVDRSPATIGKLESSVPRLALAPGDLVPVLRATDAKGQEVELAYADSKLTLVQFWISTCGPCATMLAPLEAIRAKYAPGGLRVVSVMLDPARYGEAQSLHAEAAARYPLYRARLVEADVAWGGLRVAPMTFLVNREGKLVRRYVGAAPEQLTGLGEDIAAALEGRILPMQVLPEVEAVTATSPNP